MAPTAAPNIMLLTISSCIVSLTLNCFAMKPSAPEMTPISRPNIRPARAATPPVRSVLPLFFAVGTE